MKSQIVGKLLITGGVVGMGWTGVKIPLYLLNLPHDMAVVSGGLILLAMVGAVGYLLSLLWGSETRQVREVVQRWINGKDNHHGWGGGDV
jgi:hypothetical protein